MFTVNGRRNETASDIRQYREWYSLETTERANSVKWWMLLSFIMKFYEWCHVSL